MLIRLYIASLFCYEKNDIKHRSTLTFRELATNNVFVTDCSFVVRFANVQTNDAVIVFVGGGELACQLLWLVLFLLVCLLLVISLTMYQRLFFCHRILGVYGWGGIHTIEIGSIILL